MSGETGVRYRLPQGTEAVRIALGLLGLGLLLWGTYKVLAPFTRPILWALVLATATWPIYRRVRPLFGRWNDVAAVAMTLLLLVVVVAPATFLGLAMVRELEPEIVRIKDWVTADTLELPAWIKEVPALDETVRSWAKEVTNSELRRNWLRQLVLAPTQRTLDLGKNILHYLVDAFLAVFTLFFVYRDGERAADEMRALLDRIAGGRGRMLLAHVRDTVGAVFYGWVVTAAAQGLCAMLGYWIAGLRAPVLLGAATGLAAILPFGVALIWVPVALGLIAAGSWGKALFIAVWAVALVSTIDNFLRPYLISGAARVPYILVFFGIIGGLLAFGLIGLVLGPVFLAVLLTLWRQAREALADENGPTGEQIF